ncbi:MAG: tautomerase family protein [Candidatus Bathyarchaeota archaeon]|nr:MAG: tautomerase family protein [Candidatus Bathyarchaeota archaeon]
MPVVIVEMWAGETEEDKARLIQGISRVFQEAINVKPDRLHIIIHEIPRNNWGFKGRQASKLFQ